MPISREEFKKGKRKLTEREIERKREVDQLKERIWAFLKENYDKAFSIDDLVDEFVPKEVKDDLWTTLMARVMISSVTIQLLVEKKIISKDIENKTYYTVRKIPK